MVSVLVDTNAAERQIGQRVQTLLPEAVVEFKSLDVADFVIHAHGKTLLVERKALSDFCGSLASGRLAEQAERLLDASGDQDIPIVLVQGTPPEWDASIGGIKASSIYGMINRLTLSQGVVVLWCASSTESVAHRLAQLARKLAETGFAPPQRVESTRACGAKKRARSGDTDDLFACKSQRVDKTSNSGIGRFMEENRARIGMTEIGTVLSNTQECFQPIHTIKCPPSTGHRGILPQKTIFTVLVVTIGKPSTES